jgi:D-2-hydroxyacid dehydrogenase (NADP+)
MAALRSLLIFNGAAAVYAQAVRARFPALHVRETTQRDEALRVLAGGEADAVVVSGPWVDDAMLQAGRTLRWIHALTSGSDTITGSAALAPHAAVTTSRGAHGPQMAELALLMMMALARDLPGMLRNQREGAWTRWPQPLLWGRHAVLIGMGHVGRELARRCKAMGMRVTGISAAPAPAEDFDAVHGRDRLKETVAEADFVVVLTAHDARTHHMIDAGVLAAMPGRAFLVNLARGGVVDEQALVEALRNETIAGAGLDVYETEPLAPDHVLRFLPRVIATPHIGGQSDVYAQQVLPMLLDNIAAFEAGDMAALVNRVR